MRYVDRGSVSLGRGGKSRGDAPVMNATGLSRQRNSQYSPKPDRKVLAPDASDGEFFKYALHLG